MEKMSKSSKELKEKMDVTSVTSFIYLNALIEQSKVCYKWAIKENNIDENTVSFEEKISFMEQICKDSLMMYNISMVSGIESYFKKCREEGKLLDVHG